MTDIVKMLRDDEYAGSELDHMAADEIERLRAEIVHAVAAEREACARVCDDQCGVSASQAAAAIRARSEK